MKIEVIQILKDLDNEVVELYRSFQNEIFIPSTENLAETKLRIKKLKEKVMRIRSEVYGERVKVDIWIDHLLELLDCLEVEIDESLRHPGRFIRTLGFKVHRLLFEEKEPLGEKLNKIRELANKMPGFYKALIDITYKARDDRIKSAIVASEGLVRDLERILADLLKSLTVEHGVDKHKYFLLMQILSEIGFYISSYIIEAKEIISKNRDILEDIPYDIYVEKKFGLPVSWINCWYKEELKLAIKIFEELAKNIDPTKPPLETLKNTIHRPYSAPEQMFNDMKKFLDIAKTHAREYLDFPEYVECQIVGVREFEKDIYPMGYAATPDPLEGKLECRVALNQFNYWGFSRGWLMMMAIHEAYYGHNIHAIKVALADVPSSFKVINSLGTPLSEGLAHRGEELLKHIYGDDKFPLFVAWRRVHTALRVYIEMELYYHKNISPEDAVRLYMDIMKFDETTARGLVEWHLENRGYNLCYLAGYRMLETLRSALRELDEKAFSNALFTSGFVSMRTLKKVLGIKEKLPWER
ncbi:MAG: DUF885 family protein [Thermofilaceae archaeon]